MLPTIDVLNVTLGKNPCSVAEKIKIEIKAIFIGIDAPEEPISLPFTLAQGLGGGEFE